MKAHWSLLSSLIAVLALSACSKKSQNTGPIVDTDGPSTISDLHVVSADTSSVLLGWTSPADNGGAATSYELRYRGGTGFDWEAMTPVTGLSAPKAPGQAESFRVSGLGMGLTYSFAIRSKDASGNESGGSNVVSRMTAETTVGADLIVSTAENGIWYSLNAGRSWHQAAVSDHRSSFGVLAADPQNRQMLYASSDHDNIGDYPYFYRSTDGGLNWAPMDASFIQNGAVASIAIASTAPSTIYVGLRGACLEPHNNCAGQAGAAFRSTDGGNSWQNISSGLPTYSPFGNVAVYSIAVDPTNAASIIAGVFRNNSDTGFFYSSTSGSGWGRVADNPPAYYVHTVAIDPANPARILIATFNSDAIHLSEGGAGGNFMQVSTLGGNQPIVFDPADSRYVYTALQRSVDGGRTWTPMTLPAGAAPATYSAGKTGLVVDPATHEVYAAGRGGVYRSADRGLTWTEVRALSDCTGLVMLP